MDPCPHHHRRGGRSVQGRNVVAATDLSGAAGSLLPPRERWRWIDEGRTDQCDAHEAPRYRACRPLAAATQISPVAQQGCR